MPLARRDLLRLGAATAGVLATSACRDRSGPASVSPRPRAGATRGKDRRPDGRASTPPTADYAGRPEPGTLYFGASLPYHRSLTEWEAELGTTLAVHRSFFTPDHDEIAQMVLQCEDDLENRRLPHVSTKTVGTWADVAAGRSDDWLRELLRSLESTGGPLFLTIHHEPENDNNGPGMTAPDWVAMQRRALGMAADLAPSITVLPLIQHWTFEPLRPRIDPEVWIVEEAPVLAIDVYNPWAPGNGKPWRSLGSRVEEVRQWIPDTPLVIGEYGCRENPADPGSAAAWLRDAAEYARTHNIVAMSYFNSGWHAPDGTLELHGSAERAFAELLASDWVARPV